MPRTRKRPKNRRPGLYTERIRRRLETGHDWEWLDDAGANDPSATLEELRAAWEAMRADVIRPGEPLPWAWWVFDAPEPRRTAAGEPSPLDASATYFAASVTPSAWECEGAYLDRVGVAT